ncbi:hypothetical protein BaRGS_00017065 [Batillaria attramentaria]|uniref:SOCS box domain-containing protein n=1 Tax=Batillaria attramentaria TaxID=370345 RepID=A0ABD0KWL0_9CAEN
MSGEIADTAMDSECGNYSAKLLEASQKQDWETVMELDKKGNREDKMSVLQDLVMSHEWNIIDKLMEMKVFNDADDYQHIADGAVKSRQWQCLFKLLVHESINCNIKTIFENLSVDEKEDFLKELLKLSYVAKWSSNRVISRLLDTVLFCCIYSGPTHFDLAKSVIVKVCSPDSAAYFYGECNQYEHKTLHVSFLCNHAKVINKGLEGFMSALLSDERAVCVYFGFLMAAKLKKWDLVRKLVYKYYESEVLCETDTFGVIRDLVWLNGESLKSAACLMHSMMRASTLKRECQSSSFWRNWEAVRDVLESNLLLHDTFGNQTQAHMFSHLVEVCKNCCLYGVGAIVAVWLQQKDVLLAFLKKDIDSHSAQVILMELMKADLWCLTLKFLKHHKEHSNFVLETAAARMEDSQGARIAVRQLIGTCQDTLLLMYVLSKIIDCSDVSLYQQFLAQDLVTPEQMCLLDPHTSPLFEATFVEIVRMYAHYSSAVQRLLSVPKHVHSRTDNAYAILKMSIEMGLSTRLKSTIQLEPYVRSLQCVTQTLWSAAEVSMLDVLQLLYESGATDDAVLIRCCLSVEVLSLGKSVSDVWKYLRHVTTSPRSLKGLCRLVVSHCLGCRADRKVRALALGLPLPLTRYVLFYDILYQDSVQ